jgi:hypothetical protein
VAEESHALGSELFCSDVGNILACSGPPSLTIARGRQAEAGGEGSGEGLLRIVAGIEGKVDYGPVGEAEFLGRLLEAQSWYVFHH